jgi:hypothetical protein
MAAATSDVIERRAVELGSSVDHDDAVAQLVVLADGDRDALGEARKQIVRRLHGNSADHAATAALTLVNRALVTVGWSDPFDWKIRWSQPFKRP